jgi:multiple sugar transport system permease protein
MTSRPVLAGRARPLVRRGRQALGPLLGHALSLAVGAVFALPFLWLVAGSLRQPGLAPPRGIEWLPDPVAWDNYRRILVLVPLGSYAGNSLLVVALAVPLTLLTASWAGFAMAQLPERTRRALLVLAVLLRLMPLTALWLTRFVLLAWLGLLDTVWALVVTSLMGSSPFFVLLYYWTFRRLPRGALESAWVDGAGAFRTWAQIAMPLARPTTATVAVLTFVLYWRDFLTPLLYLRSERLYTLPVGLRALQQLARTDWPLLLAGSVVLTAPIVVAFLLAQRAFWPQDRLGGLGGR